MLLPIHSYLNSDVGTLFPDCGENHVTLMGQIQDESDWAEDDEVKKWREPESLVVFPSHWVKPENAYLELIDT